jgi:PleD family two-component response regulator
MQQRAHSPVQDTTVPNLESPPEAPEERGLVLVANDHEWTARSVETILLAAGYDVVRTFTGRETLQAAERRQPHVFILDHQLPDISGLEVCKQLRENPRFGASAPILITTAGPSGRTQRMAAHEAGAWEFYGQPLDGEALLHKVRVYLEARREVLRVARDGLIDPASGLYNRHGLVRRATELVSDARRKGSGVACVAVAAATETTAGLGSRMIEAIRNSSRSADIRGRLGPSAFAVVVNGDEAVGARVAERLRLALGADDGLRIVVTSSECGSLLNLEGDALLARAATELAAA